MRTVTTGSLAILTLASVASCGAPPREKIAVDASSPSVPMSASPESGQNMRPFPGETRVPFVGGLNFVLPAGSHAAYPQGIDSAVVHISGDGFEMTIDDYGAWRGPASHRLGGRPARMSERRTSGCRERTWEVELPTTNPTMLACPNPSPRAACVPMPARASISSFCTSDASCRTVDAIIDGASFTPLPGQAMPKPDEHWTPPSPACRIEHAQ